MEIRLIFYCETAAFEIEFICVFILEGWGILKTYEHYSYCVQ